MRSTTCRVKWSSAVARHGRLLSSFRPRLTQRRNDFAARLCLSGSTTSTPRLQQAMSGTSFARWPSAPTPTSSSWALQIAHGSVVSCSDPHYAACCGDRPRRFSSSPWSLVVTRRQEHRLEQSNGWAEKTYGYQY